MPELGVGAMSWAVCLAFSITEANPCCVIAVSPGKSCLKTELQFSDMYCLMAAHVYVDLWTETGNSFSLLTQTTWEHSANSVRL